MRDAVTVNITKSPDQLLSYFSDFVEVKRVIILNNVEQLALSELSNKNEFWGSFEGVEKENDVFVL